MLVIVSVTLPAISEGYFVILTKIGMGCKAGTNMHILWNAKHLPVLVENNHLVWFEYTDFYILINPSTTITEYWQMCVGYTFVRRTLSSNHDEVTMDLMLLNVTNDVFLLISHIILPKVFTMQYPVQPGRLAEIY